MGGKTNALRFVFIGAIALALVALLPELALAAEGGGAGEWLGKRVLNFVVLALLLWFFLRRPIGRFFGQRTLDIHNRLHESEQRQRHMETRLAAEKARYEQLEREIEQLRTGVQREAQAEHDHIVATARGEAEQILGAVERRIASETAAARRELREYAAELAIELAGKRLEERVGPEQNRALVHSFLTVNPPRG